MFRVGEKMVVKGILVFVAVVAAALVLSSVAFADSLTCAHGNNCQSGSLGQSRTSGPGTLPFTGLDLAGIAGVGAVLLVSGLTLQRVTRRRR
jgi:hypothetical protein